MNNYNDLSSNSTQIDSIMNLIVLYSDSLFHASNSTDSTNYHNTLIDLFTAGRSSNADLVQDWNNWVSSRDNQASIVDSLNNLIGTNSDLEDYTKAVNHIYLNSLAKGIYALDSIQALHALSIAELCPLEGGISVFKARILYDIVEPFNYNDSLLCLNVSPLITKTDNLNNAKEFTISPNPTDVLLSINLLNKLDKKDRVIELVDITGKILLNESWSKNDSNIKEINTSKFKSGIYFIKIGTKEKGFSTVKKFLIQH
ncbi:MAG: T9SS type A sorting domain-containing protein [Saprospiraceae bacterium]